MVPTALACAVFLQVSKSRMCRLRNREKKIQKVETGGVAQSVVHLQLNDGELIKMQIIGPHPNLIK